MPGAGRLRTPSPSLKTSESTVIYADTKCFRGEGAVVAMATSYNSTMWLAMQDGRVEVRDVHTGQVVHVFAVAGVRQRRCKVWCMLSVYDVIHQEAQLWMGLSFGAIEVYTENYQLRRQLSKHLAGVYCLAQYRGEVAYAGSSDFTITQWRVADGRLLRVLAGHSNYVRCLYAEGNALVSGSDDSTVRVWDTASGASLQQYGHLHRDSGGVSALCRVGTTMWSGDQSGAIAVWRLKDGEALLVCRQLQGRVTSLRKVGARVYAGSAEGRICVFNAADCTITNRLDEHLGSYITVIACAVEVNRYFVWSGSADNTIQCWHHDEHQPMTAEREGSLDMRWYYTTQMPYLQPNEALLEQQRELTELVVLSCGSDNSVRGFLEGLGEGCETAAARYWLLDSKVRQTERQCERMEEETRAIDAVLERKTQTLEVLRRQLARLTEALGNTKQWQPSPASSAAAVSALPCRAPVPIPMATELPVALPGQSPSLINATRPSESPAQPISPPPGAAAPPQPAVSASAVHSALPPPPLQVTVAAAPLPPPPPPRVAAVPAPTPPPAAAVPRPPVVAVPPPPPTRVVQTFEQPANTTATPLTRRMSF